MSKSVSSTLGCLIAVGAVCFLSTLVAGSIRLFINLQAVVFIFSFIYGLTVVVFGLRKSMDSILGFKYLFMEVRDSDSELSTIYKNQISFSVIGGVIYALIVITGQLATGYYQNYGGVVSIVAVSMFGLLYPALVSGLVYFPLYKKLA
jgi:hypothetical protein